MQQITESLSAPNVSVITAVKNGEKYLRESIISILNQTYTNFELIIVNDYSTDTTSEILRDLAAEDARIIVFDNNVNPGLSNALNLAISKAIGKYIVRHDADDISKPHRLEVQYDYLENNPKIDILGSYIDMIDDKNNFLRTHKEPLSHASILFHTLFGTPFAHPSVAIRKSFIDMYEFKYLEIPAQDYELWVRMLNAGAVAENLPDSLIYYRVSASSDSNIRAPRHHQIANILKYQQILQYVKFPNLVNEVLSERFQSVAHFLLTSNQINFEFSSRIIANRVIKLFKEVSNQMHLVEHDCNDLLALMKMRINEIPNYSNLQILNQTKNILNSFKKKEITSVTELSKNEINSFIENVHVFIIVRDRLECLKNLVDWLINAGHRNIIFINNASTNPPLLEYLSHTTFRVISLQENLGHTALWQIPEVQKIIKANWFVYTDPDVIPDEFCPNDAVGKFYTHLLNYPKYVKAGFGLRIDDLPDIYHLKKDVIRWETQYYKTPIGEDLFEADIDTTFALYRPGTSYCFGPSIRTMGAYKARHRPWYLDRNNLPEDELYYRSKALPAVTTWNVEGEVKPLPLPTNLQSIKLKVLLLASKNHISYKIIKKFKNLLNQFANIKK